MHGPLVFDGRIRVYDEVENVTGPTPEAKKTETLTGGLGDQADQLSGLMSSKDIAVAYGLPVKLVRSKLSREYWGPGGAKKQQPTNEDMRTEILDSRSRDTKVLWVIEIVRPIIERMKIKHMAQHEKNIRPIITVSGLK